MADPTPNLHRLIGLIGQTELGSRMGVAPATISAWQTRQRVPPSRHAAVIEAARAFLAEATALLPHRHDDTITTSIP